MLCRVYALHVPTHVGTRYLQYARCVPYEQARCPTETYALVVALRVFSAQTGRIGRSIGRRPQLYNNTTLVSYKRRRHNIIIISARTRKSVIARISLRPRTGGDRQRS